MEPKVNIGFPEVKEHESIYRIRVDAEIERPFLRKLLALMSEYNDGV